MDKKYFHNPRYQAVDDFSPFKYKPKYTEINMEITEKERSQYIFYGEAAHPYFEKKEPEPPTAKSESAEQFEKIDINESTGDSENTERLPENIDKIENPELAYIRRIMDLKQKLNAKKDTEILLENNIFKESLRDLLPAFTLFLIVMLLYSYFNTRFKKSLKLNQTE